MFWNTLHVYSKMARSTGFKRASGCVVQIRQYFFYGFSKGVKIASHFIPGHVWWLHGSVVAIVDDFASANASVLWSKLDRPSLMVPHKMIRTRIVTDKKCGAHILSTVLSQSRYVELLLLSRSWHGFSRAYCMRFERIEGKHTTKTTKCNWTVVNGDSLLQTGLQISSYLQTNK